MKQLREQAKDGTLAEVLQLPVISWRVRTDFNSVLRNRREAGSGDYGDSEDYGGYDDDYDGDYDEEDEEDDNEDSQVPPTFMPDLKHPHRHHHGEETIDWKVSRNRITSALFLTKIPRDVIGNNHNDRIVFIRIR